MLQVGSTDKIFSQVPQVDADLTQQLAAYDAEPEEVAN